MKSNMGVYDREESIKYGSKIMGRGHHCCARKTSLERVCFRLPYPQMGGRRWSGGSTWLGLSYELLCGKKPILLPKWSSYVETETKLTREVEIMPLHLIMIPLVYIDALRYDFHSWELTSKTIILCGRIWIISYFYNIMAGAKIGFCSLYLFQILFKFMTVSFFLL